MYANYLDNLRLIDLIVRKVKAGERTALSQLLRVLCCGEAIVAYL